MEPINNLDIREIRKEDRKQISAILGKIKIFNSEDKKIAMELIEEILTGQNTDDYYALSAINGGNVVGYVCYGPASLCIGTYDIYYIAVDPDHFRGGIGSKLLKHAEEDLREKNARIILIETSSSEEYNKTRDFYLKHSYKEVARLKDYYKDGEDRVIYEKRLKA